MIPFYIVNCIEIFNFNNSLANNEADVSKENCFLG